MRRALVFWLTGLSGAGKRTVCDLAADRLRGGGRAVLVIRPEEAAGAPGGLASEQRRITEALARCDDRRCEFDAILVPLVSPLAETRARLRAALAPGFYEIYCAARFDIAVRRDRSGAYPAARAAAAENVVEVLPSVRYDVPENPDLRLDTGHGDPALSAARLTAFIQARLARHSTAAAG